MNSPLTFKDGVSAFEYSTKFFSAGELKNNEAIYGLITHFEPAKSLLDEDEFILNVCVKKKGFFKSGKEILTVDAIVHPDANLDLGVGDLVLWGCVDLSAKPNPFGVIVFKCELFLDENNHQFVKVT